MSTRDLKMKLTVDASGIKAAATATKDLAQQTKAVGQQFDAAAAARRKFESIQQQRAVNQQLYRLDPSLNPAVQRQQQQAARQAQQVQQAKQAAAARAGGFSLGQLAPVVGLGAVGAAIGGVNNSLDQRLASGKRITTGGLVADGLSSLPIVGSSVDLIRNAAGGAAEKATNQGIGAANAIAEANRQKMGLREDGRAKIEEQRRRAADAKMEAEGARRFSNAIAGRGRQFITDDVMGKSTTNTGTVNLQAEMAANELRTAQEKETVRQREADSAAKAAREANEARRAADANVGKMQNKEEQARRNANGSYFSFNATKATEDQDTLQQAKMNTANALEQSANKQLAADRAIRKEQEAIAEVEKARVETAQRQQAAQAAALGKMQDQLAIAQKQEQVAKAGASAFMDMSPLEQRRAANVAEKLQEGTTLTRKERQVARQIPEVQEMLSRQDEREASKNPLSQRIRVAAGINPNIQALAEANKQLAGDIAEQQAKLNATFKEGMAAAIQKTMDSLGTSIITSIENGIAGIEQKLMKDRGEANRMAGV